MMKHHLLGLYDSAAGFMRYKLPDEWSAGRYPRIAALAARIDATAPFKAAPIDAL